MFVLIYKRYTIKLGTDNNEILNRHKRKKEKGKKKKEKCAK